MQAAFELFDHTADMGIRVRAGTLSELLLPASQGLYAAIGKLVPGDPSRTIDLSLTGRDAAELLRDFLDELLVLFDRDARMVTRVSASLFTQTRLTATLAVHEIDVDRSEYHREVKAITYHELEIRPTEGGMEATLIVDI